MDKERKIELIERSLGIQHKLKVHDSMRPADTHEEIAKSLVARWELEDELKAIEQILENARTENVAEKRKAMSQKNAPSLKKKKKEF